MKSKEEQLKNLEELIRIKTVENETERKALLEDFEKDKNKKLVFTDDWLDKICPKSSIQLLENLDKQISEEINLMKESKSTENLQKLIGRPIIAMALDHPVLKRNN